VRLTASVATIADESGIAIEAFMIALAVDIRPRVCAHRSRTLIEVRLEPTSGAKADIPLPPLSAKNGLVHCSNNPALAHEPSAARSRLVIVDAILRRASRRETRSAVVKYLAPNGFEPRR